jgi:hypothetical protein
MPVIVESKGAHFLDTNRNVDVAEIERFGQLALGLNFVAPAAKIDDRGDTGLLEFGEP